MQPPLYKPRIIKNIQLSGIAAATALKGEACTIITKAFISSSDKNFIKYSNNILSSFYPGAEENANKLLILIKPDFTAYVYDVFPLSMSIKASRSIEAFELIRTTDIADIISISFKDAIADLNPNKGDQIIWLFRKNWHFGLFFDFTRKNEKKIILEELAHCYKTLMYLDIFSFLSDQSSFSKLIKDGWFPFIHLLGGYFENLIAHYEEGEKHQFYIQNILTAFDKERIAAIADGWWSNPILLAKKEILLAGIEAYNTGTKSGYINCIKTLTTELEGIIRLSYHKVTGKNPTTRELKEYIIEQGKNNFNTLSTLGFTNEFTQYLEHFVFKSFDLNDTEVPSSRHSFAHGVASDSNYSQETALQLILTIDQIYFFLGNKS